LLAYRFTKVNIFSSISIFISNILPSLSLCTSIMVYFNSFFIKIEIPMLDTLHLCSLNCQGLGQKEKRQRLFQWVKNQKTHILYAQEETKPDLYNKLEKPCSMC
jgi:hypothetical protein